MSSASGTMIIWYSPLRGAGWREQLPAAVPRRHYENFCAAVPGWHCYYFHPHTFDWLLFLPSCFRQSGPNFETCNNPWSCSVVTFWFDIFSFFAKFYRNIKIVLCFVLLLSFHPQVASRRRCSAAPAEATWRVFFVRCSTCRTHPPLLGFVVAPWPWNFLINVIIQLRYNFHLLRETNWYMLYNFQSRLIQVCTV